MPVNRRQFIQGSAAVAATGGMFRAQTSRGFHASRTLSAAEMGHCPVPGSRCQDYRPVVTPDGATLPFKVVDGVKVFHLIAEPVAHEFAPGLVGECWGYNGRVHGPTIEAVEGDRLADLRHEQASGADDRALARGLRAERHGWRAGLTQRAIEPGRRSSTSFSCASTERSCTTRTTTRWCRWRSA